MAASNKSLLSLKLLATAAGAILRRFPVRPAGVIFLLATITAGLSAILSGNNLLFLIWAVLMAAILVSGVAGRWSLEKLSLALDLPPHLSARRALTGRIGIKNRKILSPAYSVQIEGPAHTPFAEKIWFPYLAPNSEVWAGLPIVFPRRGILKLDSFTLSTQFPFGFFERRVRVKLDTEILIYPSLDPQPGFAELAAQMANEFQSRRSTDGDFHRLRPYASGDSARRIDWKSFARTRQPMVREFSSGQDSPLHIVLDRRIDGPHAEWFEQAVDGAAFLVWELQRQLGGVHFSSQGFSLRLQTQPDVYTILKFLALAEPGAGIAPLANLHALDTSALVFTCFPESYSDWSGSVHLLTPGNPPFVRTIGAHLQR